MSIRPLSKELQEKASSELKEVPSRIEDDIKQIRDWVEKQPHLNARTDAQWLLNFLRCSKFSIERAKERLDFFYTMRTLAPELFSGRDPLLPEIQDILKKGFMLPLPTQADPAGPVIILLRWNNVNSEKNSLINLCRVILMGVDILLQENDNCSIAGIVVLDDLQDYGFSYIIQQTPVICKKILLSMQNAYPIRVKQFCCVNIPSYFEAALNIFKPFMGEKLKNRLVVYGKNEFDRIYQTVPLSVLPKEYGGEGGCLYEMTGHFKNKVESYRDWFLEDAQYFSDEAKRPGKPKTSSEVFGVEGSFRKLNVD